jgi:hypothetical protein
MGELRQQAYARVTLTVEIDVGSAWAPDCSVKQVHDQAATEAINKLQNILLEASAGRRIRVVGKPKVDCIIANMGEGSQQ